MSFSELADFYADGDIRYEMLCRRVNQEHYTRRSRLSWWINQMKKEANTKEKLTVESYLESGEDLRQCENWIKEIEEDVRTWKAGFREAISVRLGILNTRIGRIVSGNEEEQRRVTTLTNRVNSLREELERKEYEIWKESLRGKKSVNFETKIDQLLLEEEDPTFNKFTRQNATKELPDNGAMPYERNSFNAISNVRSPMLYKWGIKFSGDNGESASEFLQRISDFVYSRQVKENELLSSMSDLLEGSALRWYRRKREYFRNYEQFAELFLEHFEPLMEVERLMDFLRNRKQQTNETIVQYISFMEDQFFRMNAATPAEVTRVRIIRDYLLPV